MNEYYEILGLKPGATKEEIEQTYRDLLRVWNPDSFANDSLLQKKAEEKIKGFDEAYEKLILYLAKAYEQSSQNKSERNIKPEERDSCNVYGEKTKQNNAHSKEDISSEALTLAFLTFALYLGFKFLPTSSWIAHIIIAAISGGLGGTIGYVVVQGINRLNVSKKQKVMIAWAIGIIGLLVISSVPVLLRNPKPKLVPLTQEDMKSLLADQEQAHKSQAQTEVQKGEAFMEKGSYQEAIDAFSKAIRLNPQDLAAYYDRGVTYLKLDNYQQAIRDFERVIELNPWESAAYYYRGVSYDSLHNTWLAIRDYDRAIEFNPQYSAAYYIRGLDYGMLGNYEQEINDIKIAARLGNKDAQYFLSSKGIVWQRD